MKNYRWVNILLVFAVLMSMVCFTSVTVNAAAGTVPQKGTGTAADPYIIDEPLELVWMGENYSTIKDKYFLQTADIDMSSVANFTPIGNGISTDYYPADAFTGTYDGLGFKISNLTINSNLVYVGLFQKSSGTIKNISLAQANITSTCSTYNYPYTGGIVGRQDGGSIMNCSVSGSISQTGMTFGPHTGGIASEPNGSISNCYCSAAMTSASSGGIIGGIVAYTQSSNITINNCYFSGTTGGAATTVGAIVGNYFAGTISNNVYQIGSAAFGRGGSSANDNIGCTPCSVSSMKLQATYTALGWNFASIWKMDAVTGYPTFITSPGVPANIVATPGNGQITVSWNAAAYATDYNVYYGTAAGMYGTPVKVSGTSTTITGLTNVTKYYICVKALRGSVEGTASSEVTCVPHVIISDLTASGSLSSVVITFSAPTGASIVELLQSTNGGTSYSAVAGMSLTSASTGATLTGLAAGTYIYKLHMTFAGADAYSNESSASVGGGYTAYATDHVCSYTGAGNDLFYVGTYDGVVDNAALKFDLTACAGTVKNAYLYICETEYPDWNFGNAVFDLYGRLDGTWETTLTTTQDPPSNSVLIQSGVTDLPLGTYMQMTVTDYVKNMLVSGNKNVSFYLAGKMTSATAQDDACIYSSTGSKNRPYIMIEFANDNAKLSKITVDGTSLPGFSDSTYTYSYVAPHDSTLSALNFISTLGDSSATQGAWAYDAASHAWSVTVTAPDGTTKKTYTVNVSAAAKSSDATLSSISIGGTALTGFTSSKLDYTYDIPHGASASALSLSSVVHDHMGTQGTWTYNGTSHKWIVTVTSEDLLYTKTYTVTINELPSTDATLKAIKINGIYIGSFSPTTMSYTFDVAHGTLLMPSSFVSETNDDNALPQNWSFDMFTGKWIGRVIAEDGVTEKTYYVTINELPSTDAALKSIKINGTDLTGFTSSKLDYTYDVVHGTDMSSLAFTSTFSDHMAGGTWSYDSVNHKWGITVTAEDTTTKLTYTVTINELASTDAALTGIKINGMAIPGFASSTTTYTYDVLHGTDMSALVLTSTFSDHMAGGTWSYDSVNHKWSITVKAENPSVLQTYTVTIHELPSTDASLKSIKVNGTDIAGFSPSTLSYTVDVPHGTVITPESFVSTTSDDNAQQHGWMYEIHTGEWIEQVTAEDGVTRLAYILTIHVLPSTDAALKSIKINGTDLTGFTSSELTYTYDVVHGTDMSALAFTSTFSDHMAGGTWSYDSVNHKWSITVTAEDTTTKLTYTVTINELASTDASLKSIKIGGTGLTGFSSSTYVYTYDVVHGTDMSALVLTSTFSDHMAGGTWSYDAVNHKWSITVTAEDTTTKLTYTVTIHELPSTDASLAGIKIGGANLTGFSSSTYAYTYDVMHSTDMSALAFTSTFSDHMAGGTWTYDAVNHKWGITVTAEDTTTKLTYTVTINELPSTDASLAGIKIGGTDLPGFASSTYAYTYDVVHGTDMSALAFTSTFSDHMAGGTWNYNSAAHKWSITVTAEDTTTKLTYTVTINELASTDATLTGVKVGGTALPGFSSSTYAYTYDVVHGTDMSALALTNTFSDHMASGIWSYDGVNHKWSITVTAEDTTTKLTYTVTINELPSKDASLAGIKIGGAGLTGFASSIYAYTYDVVHGTDMLALAFTSTFSDHMAGGTWSYDSVNHKWGITVTAEDTTTKLTYTVTINELPSTDATLKSIRIDGSDLAGFSSSTLSFTYSVVFGTDISKLVITSEKNDHMAAMGSWVYDAATRKWSLTVTAEDTSKTMTYTVEVTVFIIPQTGTLGDYRTNSLTYQGHVQDMGWQGAVTNSLICGTTGQSKRLEAINISLNNIPGGIEYCTHVQDIGWMDWAADGAMSGTSGQSKRLEAIRIRLTGEAAEKYDIYYRVHCQNFGWMDWAKNGEAAGTAGYSYRMEAVEIVMVLKGDPAPGSTNRIFSQAYK